MSNQAVSAAQSNSAGVQELIDRLKSDGVSRGQVEAESIVADARTQAMEILDNAKREADDIVSKAREEARQIEHNGKEALRLASRDAGIRLKESFQLEFQRRFGRLVNFTLQDNEFLKRLILEVARRSVPSGSDESFEVLLPSEKVSHEELSGGIEHVQQGTLSHFVLGLTADLLREGVTFGASDTFTAGVRVRLTDKDVDVDLTDETVSAVLLRFLAPRFRALVESAQ